MKANPVSLILDSGAFSAWNQGVSINLDEYIDFCLENDKYINFFVNLDVIPGSPGKKNLPAEEIERSAKQGYENYLYMIKKGVKKKKIIHVFHQGERFSWLKKMVKEMEYIGISPANDRSTNEKIAWLDLCMAHVCDDKGMPKVKWHGFAVTSLRLMLRYPWYSVDSTSWVMTSRMGSVYVPRFIKDKFVYDQNSWKVLVSSRSPSKGDGAKHFDNFSSWTRKIILDYFKLRGYQLGKSEFRIVSNSKNYELLPNEKWFGKMKGDKSREIEVIIEPGLCNTYKQRDELNIMYFLNLEKALPSWPWPYRVGKKHMGFGLI